MKYLFILLAALLALLSGCGESDSTYQPLGGDDTEAQVEPTTNAERAVKKTALDTLGSADALAEPDEGPVHTVALDSFRMSQYEMTYYDFAEIMNYAFEYTGVSGWIFRSLENAVQDSFYSHETLTVAFADTVHIYNARNLYQAGQLYLSDRAVYFLDFQAGNKICEWDSLYLAAKSEAADSIWYKDTAVVCTAFYDTNEVPPRSPFRIVLDTISLARHFIKCAAFTPANLYKNYPVTGVSWLGAVICANLKTKMEGAAGDTCYTFKYYQDGFTISLTRAKGGFRLPTEAEWEHAARGGLGFSASLYPTGSAISEHLANYRQPGRLTSLNAVGSYPSTGYGLYDMAGNVWEWCQDTYTADSYVSLKANEPTSNPINMTASNLMVIRGGSYADGYTEQRCANRSYANPLCIDSLVGIRLVRNR